MPFMRVRKLCRLPTFCYLMVLLKTLHALRYTLVHYPCNASVLDMMVLLDSDVHDPPAW